MVGGGSGKLPEFDAIVATTQNILVVELKGGDGVAVGVKTSNELASLHIPLVAEKVRISRWM